jgi:23S rRNA (pseudouridine1915-N3)-methyltransferase
MEEYLDRLRRYTAVAWVQGKERGAESNSLQLLGASEGPYRIGLDERGRDLSTSALVDAIDGWEMGGSVKTVSLLIGGADGLAPALRDRADLARSFGRLVWPHMLVRVMLAEQIYRAAKILSGSPYHRV